MKKSVKPHKLIQVLKQPHYLALSIALLLLLMSSSAFAYKTFVVDKRVSSESSDNGTAGPIPWSDSKTAEKPVDTTAQPANTQQAAAPQQTPTSSKPTTTAPPQKSAAELANEKYYACSNEESGISRTYNSAVDRGWAARDQYKANIEAELAASNLPEKEKTSVRFRAMYYAGLEANAIISPAYATYVSSLGTLRAKGCTVTQGYPDYTDQTLSRYEPYL